MDARGSMTYRVEMDVPLGTVVKLQTFCSPEFADEICIPTRPGREPEVIIWNVHEAAVFQRLEDLYANKLWNAIKRRKDQKSLHFNFEYSDFTRTGIDKPCAVCRYFINELLRTDSAGVCKRSNGKFRGIWFDVWGNGAFTTHFTWE